MSNQSTFFKKTDLKSPAVLLFGAVYVLAFILTLLSNPWQALAYFAMSAGILLLIWLIIAITEKIKFKEIQTQKPGLELVFAGLIFIIFDFIPFPGLGIGDKWFFSTIIYKEMLLFVFPLVFLILRKYSLSSLGLSLRNWKQNFGIGTLIFLCMAIPSALFVSNTASLIFSGRLSLTLAAVGFPILFLHNIFLSGLPEEFFFRVFIQTRISVLLKSTVGGILLASLFFGLIHIDDLLRLYPDMTLSAAFSKAFFIQGFTGLVEGFLWARTRNLAPGIIVHSGINALNNLGSISLLISLKY